ncbi:putative molybdopterin binding domain-containing protein [Ditylenchus destructor]|uniref:molybdopterin molybdotransferase n=1 Tax=Ditylenchus destructor TaxID=166010 RepID=A0AAD4R803_9BILA|nr:putative molybdopterin binding domain-containing protein [Ditylenchus destructor]
MKISVITVSDSCSKDRSLDKSGPILIELLNESTVLKEVELLDYLIVPDETDQIESALWKCIKNDSNVILTTGGTGFAKRDVTPEATKKVIKKECPGIVTAILVKGLEKTPMAALSRLAAGIVENSLIINLPGSPKAVREGFEVIEGLLPHSVALLQDNTKEVSDVHKNT